MTSIEPGPPRARSVHDRHTPQGSSVGPFSQFRQRARIRALVVLPQPRGPEKRKAWLTRLLLLGASRGGVAPRLLLSAARRGVVTWSCPMTSAKVSGR